MDKYKVLLVDDEKLIREGLKTLINWEKLGYEVIGEASNGEEALELIEKERPQLVIVDIKMPIMDGLTLIEKVNLRHMTTRFIILSGHSEFEYAKKAMSLNINQYVLKPIDSKILEEKIVEERIALEKQQQIRHARREKVLKDIVTQGYVTGEQWNDVYEEPMPWCNYQVLLANETSMKTDADVVFDKLYDYMKPEAYGFMIGNDMLFLVKDKVYGKVTVSLENIIHKIKEETGAKLRIILGGKYKTPDKIHQSYMDILDIKRNLFLYEDATILSVYTKKQVEPMDNSFDMSKFLSKLVHAIHFKDMAKMNDLLESYLSTQESNGFDEETIIANYMHMYVKLIQKLGKEDEMSYNDFERLVCQKNLQRLHGSVKFKILEIADKKEIDALKNPVERMQWMIEKEYNRELKLEDISCELGYNSAYLGKRFKKAIGCSFNQYLDKTRIQAAKSLLLDSDMKIYEVAQYIGYSSSDYFTLKFRKYEGMSPKEFKNTKK